MLANEYTKVSATKGILFTCFLLSCASLSATPVFAQSHGEDLDQNAKASHKNTQLNLQNQVHDFIENRLIEEGNGDNNEDIRIKVREIDSRIDIPFCDVPYQFDTSNSPQQQSNMSVKVSCNNTNWYLFMHASVSIIQQVVVSSDNLSPGTLLSPRNVNVVEMDKNKLRGTTFSTIEQVIGARIKRRTRSGNIISDRMLCFVCKGDRVTIAAISSGLSIKVYGVAEEDGVLGDTIQVRNISSDKLVFAKIASTSQVEISI